MPETETYYQLSGSYPLDEYAGFEKETEWDAKAKELGLKPSWGAGAGLGLRDIDWEFEDREGAIKFYEYLKGQVNWTNLTLTGITNEVIGTYGTDEEKE